MVKDLYLLIFICFLLLQKYSFLFAIRNHTKANSVATGLRFASAAIRTLTKESNACPATTTVHLPLTGCRTFRICLCIAWICSVPITTPFIHITVHIVQASGIGSKTAYRHCFASIYALVTALHREISIIIGLFGT